MFKTGIMQGRLLPKISDIYQCHPLNWSDEFDLCRSNNLDLIEWIIDSRSFYKNSIMSTSGRELMLEKIKETNVRVETICADILLEKTINNEKDFSLWEDIFNQIFYACHSIGAKIIVIPFIEKMSLTNKYLYEFAIKFINEKLDQLKKFNIKLALELDLDPIKIKNLLETIDSDMVGINYDIGNSASMGFDIKEEFECYSSKIIDIHVKDRFLNGGPCLLGTGNANLVQAAFEINKLNFKNPIIFQTFRDQNGKAITFMQIKWFMHLLHNNYYLKTT